MSVMAIRTLCEQRIRDLVPPEIYQRLLNEMYGPLRRNEYRIEYNVRNFNLEEAKKLLKTPSRPAERRGNLYGGRFVWEGQCGI